MCHVAGALACGMIEGVTDEFATRWDLLTIGHLLPAYPHACEGKEQEHYLNWLLERTTNGLRKSEHLAAIYLLALIQGPPYREDPQRQTSEGVIRDYYDV